MKSVLLLLLVSHVALLSGCALVESKPIALDPVGPPPPAEASGPAGTLVVYTALDRHSDPTGLDGYAIHTDYQVLDSAGRVIYVVRNSTGTFGQEPAPIMLPPGAYRVYAHAKGIHKAISVPVILVAHETTTVHLDGDTTWVGTALNQGNGIVRLPNGQIVGWRAAKTN